MKTASMKKLIAVALSFTGSAILLFSCDAKKPAAESAVNDKMMTEYSENMSIVMSENGRKSYLFETQLIEGYSLVRDPYREFRKGIKITTFDDSLSMQDAVLTANYAIYYENRRLWEAKGNVVVIKADGKQLYTSQLFWNQATKRIYSNVDSKIVDGDEITFCEGFESDESMKEWRYRKIKGVTYFTVEEDSEGDVPAQDDATAAQPAAENSERKIPAEAAQHTQGKGTPDTPQKRTDTGIRPQAASSGRADSDGSRQGGTAR